MKVKKFTKLVLCFCLSITCFTCSACKKTIDLSQYLSQLITQVYRSVDSKYNLKATYGFNESPSVSDGKIATKKYFLSFILKDIIADEQEYLLNFTLKEQTFNKKFVWDGVKSAFSCKLEVNDFNLLDFEVTISCADDTQVVKMQSILPKDTIDYKKALNCVYSQQKDLIDSYFDQNGVFNGEIKQRIVIKDQKAYWYIGLTKGNGNVHALLVDGKNGNILAVREVF